jgi:hypothetical protein
VFSTIILAVRMVSKRKAKKLGESVKQHWKKIFPPQATRDGFVVPCQELIVSDAERAARDAITVSELKPAPLKQLHPLLAWCRGIGLFGVLCGGLGVMQPQFFWLSVGLVFAGLLLFAVDLYFESGISKNIKIIGCSLIVVIMALFAERVVFVPAPLPLNTLVSDFDYTPNLGPAGIAWSPFFTELDLIVTNPTDQNYDNLDVLVRPDTPIAAIKQLSSLTDVSFEDEYGVTDRFTVDDGGTPITMVFLATNAGYKVHCGRIPPRNSLKLVMAIAEIKKGQPREPGKPFVLPPDISLKDISVTQTFTEKDGATFTYWFGSESNKSLYLSSPTPNKMLVTGSYIASNRTRRINIEFSVDRKLKWRLNDH